MLFCKCFHFIFLRNFNLLKEKNTTTTTTAAAAAATCSSSKTVLNLLLLMVIHTFPSTNNALLQTGPRHAKMGYMRTANACVVLQSDQDRHCPLTKSLDTTECTNGEQMLVTILCA